MTEVRGERESWFRRWRSALAAVLCAVLVLPAWADPPGRVGRLAEVQGAVWLYTPDTGEWVEAPRNQPLTSGDHLATDAGARAEVQVGSATVRLDGGTQLEVLEIDDGLLRFQLDSGSVGLAVRSREAADQIEIATAEGQFQTRAPGQYRIDRNDDASTASAWIGGLRFVGSGEEMNVSAGQRLDLWNDNGLRYAYAAPEQDAFSEWFASREQAMAPVLSAPAPYVSPEMTGAADLAQYGNWEQSPDYGSVWIPAAVATGWAPYRYGRWAWVRPWGWTWVDNAPWGFAPFHYGRWVNYRDRWCWSPGQYVARPVYAPALVAWVGGGPGGRHDRGDRGDRRGRGPDVGWFPLAPREVYVPGYKVSPRYVNNVNSGQVRSVGDVGRIIRNPGDVMNQSHYANRGNRDAWTVVPQGAFARREQVGPVAKQLLSPAGGSGIAPQRVTNAPPVTAPAAPPAGRPIAAPPIRVAGPRERAGSPLERARERVAPVGGAVPAPPPGQSPRPPDALPKLPVTPQAPPTQQSNLPLQQMREQQELQQQQIRLRQQQEQQRRQKQIQQEQAQQQQQQQPQPQPPVTRPPILDREPNRQGLPAQPGIPARPAFPGRPAEMPPRAMPQQPAERSPQFQPPPRDMPRAPAERRPELQPRPNFPVQQQQRPPQPQPQQQPQQQAPQVQPQPRPAMPAQVMRPPPAAVAPPPAVKPMQPAQPPGRPGEQRGNGPGARENQR